jgi:cytochrome P450
VSPPLILPPGPTLSSGLQLLAWLYQPARFFDHCLARYGDVFTMRLPGHEPKVMLARQDAIKAVFTGDPACLHAGAANALVEPLVGPRSVLILDGAAHQRQRRLLLSLFGGRKVVEHGQTMRELADEAVDAWPVGPELLLQPELQALTLRIILATIFNVRDDAPSRELYQVLTELLDQAKSPLLLVPALHRDLGPLTPWRRFVALRRRLDDVLRPIFAHRRRALELPDGDGGDILGRLVAARDDEGRPLSDAQLRDELVTLLVAGHETTANALSWTLYQVLAHPAVHARLLGELSEVVGDAPLGAAHLDHLPYLDATVHEGMRLNPVLGHVGRLLTAPMTLGGHALPAGAMVVPCIYLAHQDPGVFPEPRRFHPDRFLGQPFSPYAYLPFGGGARRCLGMSFALHELKIVLATILRRTDLSLRPGYRPSVSRRGVVWAPGGGVPVRQRRPPRPRFS